MHRYSRPQSAGADPLIGCPSRAHGLARRCFAKRRIAAGSSFENLSPRSQRPSIVGRRRLPHSNKYRTRRRPICLSFARARAGRTRDDLAARITGTEPRAIASGSITQLTVCSSDFFYSCFSDSITAPGSDITRTRAAMDDARFLFFKVIANYSPYPRRGIGTISVNRTGTVV